MTVGFTREGAARVAEATRHVERMLRGGPGPATMWRGQAPYPLLNCGPPAADVPPATLDGADVLPATGTVRRKRRQPGPPARYVRSTDPADDLVAENPYTTQAVPAAARTVWVTPWQGGWLVVGWEC